MGDEDVDWTAGVGGTATLAAWAAELEVPCRPANLQNIFSALPAQCTQRPPLGRIGQANMGEGTRREPSRASPPRVPTRRHFRAVPGWHDLESDNVTDEYGRVT